MTIRSITACVVASLAGAGAPAQFTTGFEPPEYVGSPNGTVLTGQQGWYLPVAGSTDYKVYTYAGNSYDVVPNPTGAEQFVAGRTEDGPVFARAEHAVDFSTALTWTISYDVTVLYDGDPPAPAIGPIGSFVLRPHPQSRSCLIRQRWEDVSAPSHWEIVVDSFGADGSPQTRSPGLPWRNLSANHWYRHSVTIDFAANRIQRLSLTDLTTAVTSAVNVSDWYLAGGASSTRPRPTAVRFFTGGDDRGGNVMAWDNLSIVCRGAEILTHPQSQTVRTGEAAVFTVLARGASVSYQWRKDGVDIPGATEPLLIIAPVECSDAGVYDVAVTDDCTTVFSDPATLTVLDCAQLGDMNCDGALNGADIDPFFLALGDPAAYAAAFPNCDINNGDINGDGSVNGADIDPFFECLRSGSCP